MSMTTPNPLFPFRSTPSPVVTPGNTTQTPSDTSGEPIASPSMATLDHAQPTQSFAHSRHQTPHHQQQQTQQTPTPNASTDATQSPADASRDHPLSDGDASLASDPPPVPVDEFTIDMGSGPSASPIPATSGTGTVKKSGPGMSSKRVADSSSLVTKQEKQGFFSSLLDHTVPIDKMPTLPPPFRIAIVGASKSGKTQLVNRYLTGMYDRNYNPTNKSETDTRRLHTVRHQQGPKLYLSPLFFCTPPFMCCFAFSF